MWIFSPGKSYSHFTFTLIHKHIFLIPSLMFVNFAPKLMQISLSIKIMINTVKIFIFIRHTTFVNIFFSLLSILFDCTFYVMLKIKISFSTIIYILLIHFSKRVLLTKLKLTYLQLECRMK